MRISIERQIITLGWALHAVGVVALGLVLLAYLWFVWNPISERRLLCEQRISQLEQLLKRAPHVRSENQTYKAEIASLKQSVEETQKRLPQELREHEFLEQVRAIAEQTGMELQDYQMGDIEQLESYSKAQLTLQCHGSFASICRFLDEIDHLARITEAANLQIETADNFNRYPLQVTFVLYFGGSSHDRRMRGDVL
jgi:Tfp pilus assembly protein PilO